AGGEPHGSRRAGGDVGDEVSDEGLALIGPDGADVAGYGVDGVAGGGDGQRDAAAYVAHNPVLAHAVTPICCLASARASVTVLPSSGMWLLPCPPPWLNASASALTASRAASTVSAA